MIIINADVDVHDMKEEGLTVYVMRLMGDGELILIDGPVGIGEIGRDSRGLIRR